MEKKIINFLRATFSDRDFLDDQNLSIVHQIILGLKGQKMSEALKERSFMTDTPDNRGHTPLIWAAIRGDTDSLQELVKYGADVEYQNNNGWNALYAAVNHSRLECALTLLSYGYDDYKDGYGMTALHCACQQTDPTYVQLLLEHNVNVNEQDVFQRCPLALAAWRNNARGVACLLKRGADREVRDIFGATPLLRAVQYAAVDAAGVLIENHCNVLAVDHELQTLLHRAVLSRDIPTIELLAEKSHILGLVDVNAKDNSGKTAKQRLQTVEPSADLLIAFTAMIAALDNAKQTKQAKSARSKAFEDEQEIFKDAIQYQPDRSPASSGQTSDDEKAQVAKLLQRPRSQNWALKYKKTFRTSDRHPDSATTSLTNLFTSKANG